MIRDEILRILGSTRWDIIKFYWISQWNYCKIHKENFKDRNLIEKKVIRIEESIGSKISWNLSGQ